MHAKLDPLAALAPLGPGITEDAVGQQAEVQGSVAPDALVDALGAVTGLAQTDLVLAWRDFRVDGSRRP
jgi:hypothetical protein